MLNLFLMTIELVKQHQSKVKLLNIFIQLIKELMIQCLKNNCLSCKNIKLNFPLHYMTHSQ